MGKRYQLNCLIEQDLEKAIREYQEKLGSPSFSAAVRDLLRQAVDMVPDSYTAGWQEGFMDASRQVREAISSSLYKLDPSNE